MAKRIAILAAMALLFSAWASDPPFKPLQAPGLENLFSLGPKLFSGSAPAGDEGFTALQKLGIKTIITVDGAKPDLDKAHQHGMRYIHLPHGYDGISANVQAQLIKAAELSEGPIFVHCHHGQHRGPAAAAIICMAEQSWTPTLAEAWLTAAGTSTNYDGLFKTVRDFKAPSPAELQKIPAEFAESKEVSALVDAMVQIDHAFDRIKKMRAGKYQPPKDDPDLNAAHEMTLLLENFREAQRLPEAEKGGSQFLGKLSEAEQLAKDARAAYQKQLHTGEETLKALDAAVDSLAKQCSTCHRTYRDRAPMVRLK
jgi:hypothetical protein